MIFFFLPLVSQSMAWRGMKVVHAFTAWKVRWYCIYGIYFIFGSSIRCEGDVLEPKYRGKNSRFHEVKIPVFSDPVYQIKALIGSKKLCVYSHILIPFFLCSSCISPSLFLIIIFISKPFSKPSSARKPGSYRKLYKSKTYLQSNVNPPPVCSLNLVIQHWFEEQARKM